MPPKVSSKGAKKAGKAKAARAAGELQNIKEVAVEIGWVILETVFHFVTT